jgi:hypothetical protein
MPEQLKPCPICSSLSVGLYTGEDEITHEIYNQAFCTSCGVSGPRVFADEISAIAAWNSLPRRPDYNDVDCKGCQARQGCPSWDNE